MLPDMRAQIIDQRTAYQIVSLLQGVVQYGTGVSVRAVGKPIAGKTGTSNESKDTWFVGFSPDLACELTRMTGFLLSTGLMKANLHYPNVMGEVLTGVQRGTEMGNQLKRPLLVTNWRAYLDWTIPEIRADLNVVNAPPPGTWDWTNEARRG